jgi:hypothetical protein
MAFRNSITKAMPNSRIVPGCGYSVENILLIYCQRF